jgi:hypothetical protein
VLQELDLDAAEVDPGLSVETVRRYASAIALLGPASLRTPLGRFIQADTDPEKYDRDKARTAFLEAVQRAMHLERRS